MRGEILLFKIGDLIVYGQTGVCEVTDICKKKLTPTDKEREYYKLIPLYSQNSVIFTPIDNQKVFMRNIISREDADRLIDLIPEIKASPFHSNIQRDVTEHYEKLLQSHSCRSLVELTMSIYQKKREAVENKRKIGSVDERFMKRAEELLFGELAAALNIEPEGVQSYISSRIE